MIERYDIFLANLDPVIGNEYAKKRLIKKIDHLDDVTAFKLRLLITEMYGESASDKY